MLRSAKYGLYGAVLAGLIGAPVAWGALDKSVTLTVDGTKRTISTTASDVRGLLADEGLSAGAHDLLAPTATAQVKDDMTVVLRRGRLLHLDVDGKPVDVWTTAPTVSQALAQLGYSSSDFVSVSRARRLPLDPTAIAIRTPRVVTVVHDGTRETVSTTEPTVGRVLAEIEVAPDSNDTVSLPTSTATRDGQVVTVRRVSTKRATKTAKIGYGTTRRKDKSMDKGDTEVIRPGRNGKAEVTYEITYVDGKAKSTRTVRTVTLTKPRTRVLAVGTRKVTVSAPNAGTPDPGSAKAFAKTYMSSEYGWGDAQYDCLVTMWNHESGWRINAANPSGAYGIPQALPGSKMSSAGSNWQTSYETQVKWGLGYIKARYSTPCGAWGFWQAHNYY